MDVRAFVQMREQLMANAEILRRLSGMNRKFLEHDDALVMVWNKLRPLLTHLRIRRNRVSVSSPDAMPALTFAFFHGRAEG